MHKLDVPTDQIKGNGENDFIFQCQQCEKTFDRKQNLRIHVRYGSSEYGDQRLPFSWELNPRPIVCQLNTLALS